MSSNIESTHQFLQSSASQHRFSHYWLALLLAAVLSFVMVESVTAAETVNINTADIATLTAELSGVGPKLARRIVEFRERHGDFETVAALGDVKGVGEAILLKNADKIILE
ncbi:MAG: helix-hairpin-helix domain-containing protein [Halieaceae bacterium]|jgi:competence protein ComEA